MLLNTILLQEAAAAGGGFNGIFMIVAILAIFYFMMVRPQQKKQKEIRKFREGLQVGDKVVTAGGIHGKITAIKDDHFIIAISKGVDIKVEKGSVYPSGASQQEAQQTQGVAGNVAENKPADSKPVDETTSIEKK